MNDESIHAPEFPDDGVWLNTNSPPTLPDMLAGNTVGILLFWSHSDVHSPGVFEELEQLSNRMSDAVTVVSVHSPVFDAEQNRDLVEHGVERLDSTIPVLLDQDRDLKRRYGISGTPSLLLLDPDANVVGTLSGRTPSSKLREAVRAVLEENGDSGPGVKEEPEPISTQRDTFYPELMSVRSDGRRVAVTDPHRHRVLLLDKGGELIRTIGGRRGDRSGDLDEARFRFPRGVTFADEGLYVCDTGNHRVKGIDVDEKRVYDLLGDGTRGRENDYSGPGDDVGLQAPYDLVKTDNVLWITMAGGHQIWRYQVLEEQLDSFLGTGAEGVQDGPHTQVTMAQPTGITADEDTLYFVDSRSSSLRRYDPSEDWVETPIGQGLFEFGDVDGDDEDALMQFPRGLAAGEDYIYVADSFNHKIKRFDPEDGELESWLGNGDPASQIGTATGFFGPTGVSVGNNQLFIADTNNHRCLAVDCESWESRNWFESAST